MVQRADGLKSAAPIKTMYPSAQHCGEGAERCDLTQDQRSLPGSVEPVFVVEAWHSSACFIVHPQQEMQPIHATLIMSIKVQISPYNVLLRLQGQVQKTHLPKGAIKCQSLFSRSCYFLYLGAGGSLIHVCSEVSRTRSSLKIVNRWKVQRNGGAVWLCEGLAPSVEF